MYTAILTVWIYTFITIYTGNKGHNLNVLNIYKVLLLWNVSCFRVQGDFLELIVAKAMLIDMYIEIKRVPGVSLVPAF